MVENYRVLTHLQRMSRPLEAATIGSHTMTKVLSHRNHTHTSLLEGEQMNLKRNILSFFVTVLPCWFFELKKGNDISVKQGDRFLLSCTTDAYYEFCMFRSPQGQVCDREWKRGVWNLTQISCEGLEERLSFVGSYDDYECAVLVEDADEADNGFGAVKLILGEAEVQDGHLVGILVSMSFFQLLLPQPPQHKVLKSKAPCRHHQRAPNTQGNQETLISV
jgi:hypothetical protein